MKIICINNSVDKLPLSMYFKPQTCLLSKNRPFFVPSFTKDVRSQINIALRINKLGKNISSKFAHTYISEYGAAVNFIAHDTFLEQKENGLPTDIATHFDYSSALQTNLIPFNSFEDLHEKKFLLHNNKEQIDKIRLADLQYNIPECIEFLSKYTTLKIGDIILIGDKYNDTVLNINDRIEVFENERIQLYSDLK